MGCIRLDLRVRMAVKGVCVGRKLFCCINCLIGGQILPNASRRGYLPMEPNLVGRMSDACRQPLSTGTTETKSRSPFDTLLTKLLQPKRLDLLASCSLHLAD